MIVPFTGPTYGKKILQYLENAAYRPLFTTIIRSRDTPHICGFEAQCAVWIVMHERCALLINAQYLEIRMPEKGNQEESLGVWRVEFHANVENQHQQKCMAALRMRDWEEGPKVFLGDGGILGEFNKEVCPGQELSAPFVSGLLLATAGLVMPYCTEKFAALLPSTFAPGDSFPDCRTEFWDAFPLETLQRKCVPALILEQAIIR